jgi:hypothetical protein
MCRCGVVHPRLDPSVQLVIAETADRLLAIELLFLCLTDHLAGDCYADVSDPSDFGVQHALVELVLVDRFVEGNGGLVYLDKSVWKCPIRWIGISHHLIGYVDGFAQNGAETDSWEDVHVAIMISM